jgi:hypothetical protein
VTSKAVRLDDLVRHIRGAARGSSIADILLERADKVLAADGGRDCARVLTDVEIDQLLAGDEPKDAA